MADKRLRNDKAIVHAIRYFGLKSFNNRALPLILPICEGLFWASGDILSQTGTTVAISWYKSTGARAAEVSQILHADKSLRYPAGNCLRYNPRQAISPTTKSPWKFFFASSFSGLRVFVFKQNLRV